ncbi:hypothetical protein, partial [Salmonella sp. s54836]|uniref:hypothetical protein n=1 Tax=Salmonella sp. s54836 TaxID=3159673 RepID=UPI00397F8A24
MGEVSFLLCTLSQQIGTRELVQTGVPDIRQVLEQCLRECQAHFPDSGSESIPAIVITTLLSLPGLELGFT